MSHQKKYNYALRDASSAFGNFWAVGDKTTDYEVGLIFKDGGLWYAKPFQGAIVKTFETRSQAIEALLTFSRTAH